MYSNNVTIETETLPDVHNITDVDESKPKLCHDSTQYNDPNHSNPQLKNEENKNTVEPLFVIDTTKDFQLRYPIQCKSFNNNRKTTFPKPYTRVRTPNPCWNCGLTDHSLINCRKYRNHHKIAENREIFLRQKEQKQQQHQQQQLLYGNKNKYPYQKHERYFLKDQSLPYITKYTPGKLSENLLKALNVPRNGLPIHIYKMRKWGYPKGWLEEAKEQYSGISIFTAPNECLPFPEKQNENEVYYKINKNKLFNYPGFNAPCPPNTVDECKLFGCPEYNPQQSLENMYESLLSNQDNIKSTTFTNDNCSSNDTGVASKSIETLTEAESLTSIPVEQVELNSKPPSSPEDGEITEDDICINTYSVKSPSNNSNEIVPEKDTNEHSLSDTFLSCVETTDLSVNNPQLSSSDTLNAVHEADASSSSEKRKFGDIKSEVLGTPILKRFSTYEKRPTSASFAKGMVDIVEHENLPNAVGTFKKIKDILIDVRKTLNNLL